VSDVRIHPTLVMVAVLALLGGGCAERAGHDETHAPREHPAHADHAEHADDADHADEDARTTFSVADLAAHGVAVATAGRGTVDVAVELPGEIRPNGDRLAHIAPRFAGIVRDVRKRAGDAVRAGEVLAVVETENLARFELTASFDGTVIDRHITPGEAVSPDRPAFIVADLSAVWVDISVYQKALPRVRVGELVRIRASHGEAEAEGSVSYVTPIVDQVTRTATARVVLPNPDGSWRPGLFVMATVFDPAEVNVAVPREALQRHDGHPVVFVVEDDRFVPRRVAVGRIGRARVEIAGGLAPGERYAASGSFLVKAELEKGEAEHDH
jgi:cobalt-zinc-cadmium efflux system membrane fusion protein